MPRGAGSIFRPKYRAPDGTVRQARIWWMQVYDGTGRRPLRLSTGTADEGEAREILRVQALGVGRKAPGRRLLLHDAFTRLGEPAGRLEAGALLNKAVVYAWMSPRGEIRYVGMSRKGLERPLASRHQIAAMIGPRDVLVFWCFASEEDAAQAERNVLAALGPAWNRQRPSHSRHRA